MGQSAPFLLPDSALVSGSDSQLAVFSRNAATFKGDSLQRGHHAPAQNAFADLPDGMDHRLLSVGSPEKPHQNHPVRNNDQRDEERRQQHQRKRAEWGH